MSVEKIKVVLLGVDSKLLENVSDRVNSTRPAEVTFFTDLKDFLEHTIENKPDLVGLSVGFPHKSTSKFPKVFKMALNVPVLTFGENQDFKTRKSLSSSTADLKISGVITAHNLWMKLINLQKMREDAENAVNGKGDNGQGKNQVKNSVFLKGGSDKKPTGSKSNILSNLFAALDNPDKAQEDPNMNMVGSSNATKFKKADKNHLNSKDDDGTQVGGNAISHMGGSAEGGEPNSSNMNHLASTAGKEAGGKSNLNNVGSLGNQPQEDSSSMNQVEGGANAGAGSTANMNHLSGGGEENQGTLGSNRKNSFGNDGTDEDSDGKKKDLEFAMGGIEKGPDKEEADPKEKNSKAEEELDEAYNANKANEPEATSPEENDKEKEESPFGKVQLSDEKEVKEEAQKKSKEKIAQENLKKKNILKVASESALESNYSAQAIMEAREFDVSRLAVFTVNMEPFMGYLVLSNSFNHEYDLPELEEFREDLLKNIQDQGAFGEISFPYLLDVSVEAYDQVIDQFTEFNITHEDETGKQLNVAFVKRELLTPTFSESDKKDMFLVDIKVIPPQTPVNFDAFIYLPRNKRFVRYLKDGRSLSLKQAKRHSEEADGQSKLYLPKDHKRKFEQFFIQNTLNWEFAIHSKKEDAA